MSDTFIRVAYFKPRKNFHINILKNKKNEPLKNLILVEEAIPPGIISNGELKDVELLSKILKDIWRKEKIKDYYAIVSIPEDKIYSKIFTFPKNIDNKNLNQAVEIAIDFQTPFKRDEVYTDWEKSERYDKNKEVIISSVPKNIVNNYIEALDIAEIKILALESSIASISRSIKQKENTAFILIKENNNSLTVFILENNSIKFSRTLPDFFINDKNKLEIEFNKIKNSFDAENHTISEKVSLSDLEITEAYRKYPELNNKYEENEKWLVCLGAIMRGEIKDGEDNKISLLPIKTSEAYEYQKIKIFIVLIRNIIIGVSLFFIGTFIASYLFIFSLSQKTNISDQNLYAPIYSINENEALIKKVNGLTSISKTIISETPNWSILINEIRLRTINGIVISNFKVVSINEPILIIGISKNRDILNQFKKSLQESTYLSSVELPITNLEQKGDIPFSLTFKIKDPNMFYNK